MKKDYIGIDLGSNNTLIYSSFERRVVFNEPTCLVINKENNTVRSTGYLASRLLGKTPQNMSLLFPVRDGLIQDDEAAYLFLERILKDSKVSKGQLANLVFTAPSNCSRVNYNTLINLGKRLGGKEIHIESQAKIAALGTGTNVFSPTATMVIQIGAGISDIACLSLGEIAGCDSTYIAGNTFDEAIRRYMIQNQHLSIGEKSAEYIKMKVGTLSPTAENRLTDVKGKDTITSLPASVVVSSGEIRNCLLPLANLIALKVSDVISKLPEELTADLTKNGIIISGGGALLNGMKEYLQKTLMIPIRTLEKPSESTGDGFRAYDRILNNI